MPGCAFLFCTNPEVTYAHPTVLLLWKAVWTVAVASLTLLLAWGGLSLIMREHINPRWATWRELMPRLAIATLTASTSLWWGSLVIDLNNAIIGYFRSAVLSDGSYLLFWNIGLWSELLADQPWETLALYVALLAVMLFYGLFFLLLIIQLFIRLALIDALLVLSPVALVLWVLPQTAGWSAQWLRLFMVTVFQQAVQVVVLTLGTLFLLDAQQPLAVPEVLLRMPVGIAILYLSTKVPSLIDRASAGGVYESWGRTPALAFLLWRTIRGLGSRNAGSRSTQPFTPASGGGNSGPSAGSSGGGGSHGGTPPPTLTIGYRGVLPSPPKATALAAQVRLALPPPRDQGNIDLGSESRMTRILLDHAHSRLTGESDEK